MKADMLGISAWCGGSRDPSRTGGASVRVIGMAVGTGGGGMDPVMVHRLVVAVVVLACVVVAVRAWRRRRSGGAVGVPRQRTADTRVRSGKGFSITFFDRATGARVASDPGLVEALLAKHGRYDLVGARYYGRPTEDGYEITFD